MVYLARQKNGLPAQARDIADRESIPEEFLYKIFQVLTRSGLVTTVRGPKGGFKLAKDPKKISVGELIEVLQGPLAANRCFLPQKACAHAAQCHLKDKWANIQQDISKMFDHITLAKLARSQ